MSDKHDMTYYAKCMMGGILACGLTHTAMTPIDLVKCRKQVAKELYPSIAGSLNKVKAEEGVKGLSLGWVPTLIGYSLQGFAKFGFYEIFKDVYGGIVGQENAVKYKKIVWAFSSASAELIADVFLCPFESVKVRMQTSLPPGSFPNKFGAAYSQIGKEAGNPYFKALAPLWARQVPYTVVKFVAFEYFVEKFYKHIFTKGKENYSKGTQLFVSFLSGYAAGVFCAIVSHPADTMVSKLNDGKVGRKEGEALGGALSRIYKDIGFAGLWFGLGARIFMIGTLTGLQWWIYDSFKTAAGLQTTGGSAVKKDAVKH